ncbi:MAG: branched-chain amino acid ABC transporter permease, partial [Acidimicrobiia bacterium]
MAINSRTRRWSAFAACLLVAVLLPVLVPHPFVVSLLAQALVWAILAASWDLLSGYTGQNSFGHAGFFAIGAYTGAALALHLKTSVWIALAAGFVLPALVGFVLGWAVLRLHGHYLALVTLGFAEIIRLVAINWLSVTGGPFGIHDYGTFPGVPTDPLAQRQAVYFIVLAIAAIAIGLMLWLCEETDTGRLWRAVREDPILASSQGIDVRSNRIRAFTFSAAFAGRAGGREAVGV